MIKQQTRGTEEYKRKLSKTMQWRLNNPDKVKAARQRYNLKHRLKRSAHLKLERAVKRGDIVKEVCTICGSLNVEGHHDDYNKPLNVWWLCLQHHQALHVILRRGK